MQRRGSRPAPEDWSDSAYVGIRIEGPFHCLGTEENPVVFEPEKPGAGASAGTACASSDRAPATPRSASRCSAGANEAIRARKAGFFVHHSLFEGNNTGIALEPRGDLSIVNCAFLGNRSAGLPLDKARPRIAANLFAGNRGYGIWADGRLGLSSPTTPSGTTARSIATAVPMPSWPAGTSDTVPDAQGNPSPIPSSRDPRATRPPPRPTWTRTRPSTW